MFCSSRSTPSAFTATAIILFTIATTATTTAATTAATTATTTAQTIPDGCQDLLRVCNNPDVCPIMQEEPPGEFDVFFRTNVGRFTIHVVTDWAPPFAKRFWQLSRLKYMENARFYRVASHDFVHPDRSDPAHRNPFVIQFGQGVSPAVDNCWTNASKPMWSTEPGGPVVPPGNQRGYVSFSMNSQPNKTDQTPYCQYPEHASYCTIGFSNEIFINLGNNSKLDGPGFSIFGRVDDVGMKTVDRIWKWYGEVQSLCKDGSRDPFCRGYGANNKGVDDYQMEDEQGGGLPYLKSTYPKLSYIRYVNATASILE